MLISWLASMLREVVVLIEFVLDVLYLVDIESDLSPDCAETVQTCYLELDLFH
jgi:hypothetical protein